MTVKEIVLLWYETQMGDMKKCKEKQFEFSDMMWKLYDEFTLVDGSDNKLNEDRDTSS